MRKLILLTFGPWSLAILVSGNEGPCVKQCQQSYGGEKESKACSEGCKGYFASVTYTKDNDGEADIGKIMDLCSHSCEDALKNDPLFNVDACHKGCEMGASGGNDDVSMTTPAVQDKVALMSRPKNLFDIVFGEDIFKDLNDSHRNNGGAGGLTISFGLPRLMRMNANNMGNMEFPQMNMLDNWIPDDMRTMMNRMHSSMNSMLRNMRQNIPSMSAGESHGGKVFISRSGPGYHEEKEYDILPDGQMTLIKNDMMDEKNPLEERSDPTDDVEVFDQENKLWSGIDEEFAKIVRSEQEQSRREHELVEPMLREMDENIARHVIKEGPVLPEHGLRPRDVCQMDSQLMKWSDWVSCLHLRLGMPRWIMTSTLLLGIIFLIWLCLVIPNNAPKQRVKKPTNPKEAEALAVVKVEKQSYAKDLPPAYEEVANMKVQLEPVHQETKKPESSA